MSFAMNFPGEKELLDYAAIQREAGVRANHRYIEIYGIDKSRDSEWTIGGERHKTWLKEFDDAWASLLLNPEQPSIQ